MKEKNKKGGQTPISLIIALSVEILLLILIFLILVVALLGVFLPFLPAIFFIGLAVGLYTLLIKSNFNKITLKFHPHLMAYRDKLLKIRIIDKSMGIIKSIRKKKVKKEEAKVLKYGLVLLGFNFGLVLALLLGFVGFSVLAGLVGIQGILLYFVPIFIIFIFAASSGIVWFRFGLILGSHFKKRKILNATLAVLISILPLLVFLVLFSGILSLAGGFTNQIFALTFLGILMMSILAAIFEMIIVSLGAIVTIR